MKIYIRVDAYTKIALGHLNRCINLAVGLRNYGHDVTFICFDDPKTKIILNKMQFQHTLVPFKINDKENLSKEFTLLKNISNSTDLLIIDSYKVDNKYFVNLKNYFSTIGYLDDLRFDFDVDLVINPSCNVNENNYKAKNVLCGLKYVILGEEFKMGRQSKINLSKRSIIITMGGVDHYNLSSRAIPILENLSKNIELNIVIGPYYENKELIRSAVNKSFLKINVFENLSNLVPIILKSNIALTAGGFTSYELASLSTASVGIALWKNQHDNIKCLSNQGALIPLYYSHTKDFDNELSKQLSKLINDDGLVLDISKKARNVIDGNGTNRIIQKITEFYE